MNKKDLVLKDLKELRDIHLYINKKTRSFTLEEALNFLLSEQ